MDHWLEGPVALADSGRAPIRPLVPRPRGRRAGAERPGGPAPFPGVARTRALPGVAVPPRPPAVRRAVRNSGSPEPGPDHAPGAALAEGDGGGSAAPACSNAPLNAVKSPGLLTRTGQPLWSRMLTPIRPAERLAT